MLLTQRQAVLELRRRAGLSEATATARVAAMQKTQDGARAKVHKFDIELVIAEVEAPPKPVKVNGMRPFSPRKIAAVRAWGMPLREKI